MRLRTLIALAFCGTPIATAQTAIMPASVRSLSLPELPALVDSNKVVAQFSFAEAIILDRQHLTLAGKDHASMSEK